jgi:hypothetical protein
MRYLQLTDEVAADNGRHTMVHEDAQEVRPADEDVCPLRTAVQLAQEMEARLGSGEILFGAVSPRIAFVIHRVAGSHLVF